jgi:Fe-S cluster assembly scaffold protein SufB
MNLADIYDKRRSQATTVAEKTPVTDHQQGLGLVTKRSHINLPDTDQAAEAAIQSTGQVRVATPRHEEPHKHALMSIPHEIEDRLDAVHVANADVNVIRITESGHHTVTVGIPHNSYTHNILHIPNGVNATVLLDYETDGHGFSTEFIDVHVDDNATAHLTEIRRGEPEHTLYTRREATLGDDATMHWTQCDTGSGLLTNFTKTHLLGDNSESRTTNLFYGNDSREFDVSLESHHTGENTYSFIRSRGALRSAKSTQRGLVRINKPAFDADGYQKADNLLLDSDANAVSIPDLEIHNPNVQCSHGSTVSSLDDEQLFYLQTRGYNDLHAKKLLVEGFFTPYIERVKPEDAQSELRDLLVNNIQSDLDAS